MPFVGHGSWHGLRFVPESKCFLEVLSAARAPAAEGAELLLPLHDPIIWSSFR
jgi:hypothetical protein